jgi:hypothetical protein
MRKCRHRKTWLLTSGHLEWCYECGAIRQMQPSKIMNATMPAIGKNGKKARFINPVGTGGDNPYEKLVDI